MILSDLATSLEALGFRLSAHDEIASTNDEAIACARTGAPGRLWVVARSQTKGRGRNGRSWTSEPGNLFASLLLIDPVPLTRAPELGFVVSLACACALQAIVGDKAPVGLKWPNDLFCGGAKVGGVLLESAALEGGTALVAGIGVNCASHPVDTLYPANDLGAILARPVAAEEAFAALAQETARWLGVWTQPGGFSAIRREWLARALGVGERIRVAARRGGDLEGVFSTIDESGRLALDAGEAGEIRIDAGDVFLTGAAQ